MRLLRLQDDGSFSLVEMFGKDIPQYTILSHTWGASDEEVTFRDLTEGTGKEKVGYRKLTFCGKQTAKDNLQYFWVDTCCIDKWSSTELSEAINSMFRWYKEAAKCYVYLSDVTTTEQKAISKSFDRTWEPAFRKSRWFTRGWTLQELLAPNSVEFFSREGGYLGDKTSLERQIHEITDIAIPALKGTPLSEFSIEDRLSWAESRRTTREEDKAYSLLGIFGVCMPLLYGEGEERAFKRLKDLQKQESELELMARQIAVVSQAANKTHAVESALELMAAQISIISQKANEVDTLKITTEIMKNKISRLEEAVLEKRHEVDTLKNTIERMMNKNSRLEEATTAPARSSPHASATPYDHSAYSAKHSHAIPSSHASFGKPHVNTSQTTQRVVPTQSQSCRATVNVGTKRNYPNGIDSTQVSVGQPTGASKRSKLAPVGPSATYASSQVHSTTTITESISHS